MKSPSLLFVVNEAYFLVSHRLRLARTAQKMGFAVHVAAPEDYVWVRPGFSTAELAEEGFVFHPLPISRRGQNPFRELATYISILRLFRRVRPDVVHLLTIKPILYGGIAARIARVPGAVVAVTGLGEVFIARGVLAALRRMLVKRLLRLALGHRNMHVVFQSEGDRATIEAIGALRHSRASAIFPGSGVDLAEFMPRPDPDGTPLIVLAARLIWDKGVAEFVDAARLLRRQGVVARFALVGATHASNPRAVPADQLRSWAEDGVVEHWGHRDDMPAVLAQCHIFCLPTTYGEGVPRVLLEAAATGRPIVATDIPGCREVVDHGKNGILVPKNDAAALAAALRELILDGSRRRAMGRRAREVVEERFDERIVVARTIDLYRDLVSKDFEERAFVRTDSQ